MTQENQQQGQRQQQPHQGEQQPGGRQQPSQVNVSQGGEDSFLAGFKGSLGVMLGIFFVGFVLPCGGCLMCTGGTAMLGGAADYEEGLEEMEEASESDEGEGEGLPDFE